MTRTEELEKMLEKVCGQYEDDCNRCPRRKECEEYCHSCEDQHKTK